jgi:hypothetical protein
MNKIDENKRKVLQLLNSQKYEIDEVEGIILASKYCQRKTGGVICLLLESVPPFDKFQEWGTRSMHPQESDIGGMVSALNNQLIELVARASQ